MDNKELTKDKSTIHHISETAILQPPILDDEDTPTANPIDPPTDPDPPNLNPKVPHRSNHILIPTVKTCTDKPPLTRMEKTV